jgi:transcriptional regulator with XRE-family HTH domain
MPMLDTLKFYQEIGSLIQQQRKNQGISQELLGNYLNLTRASVINLEKGRHRPALHQIFLIADLLNIDYTNLFPKVEQKKSVHKEISLKSLISDQTINNTSENAVLNFLSTLK